MKRSTTLMLTLSLALTVAPAFAAAAGSGLDLTKRHGADDPAGDDRGGQGGNNQPGDDRGRGGNGGNGGGNGGGAARSRAGVFKFDPRSFAASEGAGVVRVSIERSKGQQGAVSVTVTAAAGTASAGADFDAAPGVLSWAAGEGGIKTFSVTIKDDATSEPRETVKLALSAATGGALIDPARGKSILTILDNDGAKACVADESTLCLASSRFQVTVEGSSGSAAFDSTEEEGRFAFAGSDRAALKVRVLDACAAAGSFWIALDSTAADDFVVKVTDTWSGLTREYVNTSGPTRETAWDTETFPCGE